MAEVRVLVGTRKGAFVISSDGARRDWKIEGPYFEGWEVMHVQGSPADPDRLYASQWTDWHGQLVQRSDDGGKSWEPVGNEFTYEGVVGTHQWYDGTLHPWEFKRVWHLTPSPGDPDTVLQASRTQPCFVPVMVVSPGVNSRGYGRIPLDKTGRQGPEECAFTRS